jgi:hypothetical protein
VSKRYYVDFDTKDMAPRIKATYVEIGVDVIRDMDKQLPINLCDHPLYAQLARYVQNNPPRQRHRPRQ